MKNYLPFIAVIVPVYTVYMFSSVRYIGIGYFIGAYATFKYDHKPMYDLTKPYVEPVLDEMIKVTNVARRLYNDQTKKEEERSKSYFPNLPSWFRNPFS